MENSENLLTKIKKLAKERNISLSELEKKAEIAPRSIYSWKSKNPTATKIQKVADVLNTNADYLLGRSNNPKPIDKKDDPALFFRIDMQNVPEEKRPEFKRQLGLLKDYMIDQLEKMENEDTNNQD